MKPPDISCPSPQTPGPPNTLLILSIPLPKVIITLKQSANDQPYGLLASIGVPIMRRMPNTGTNRVTSANSIAGAAVP
jgi:hypothetical protein